MIIYGDSIGSAFGVAPSLRKRVVDDHLIDKVNLGSATLWPSEASPEDDDLDIGWIAALLNAADIAEDSLNFAEELNILGIARVVLIGMGGSAEGARALVDLHNAWSTIEESNGIPVTVLNTIVPERVLEMEDAVDPKETLFIIASQSGTTTETVLLYRHFRNIVEEAVGRADAGRHFASISSPDSPLSEVAKSDGFLRSFESPKYVCGRFSVFTYFGLLPATLAGVDVPSILGHAIEAAKACEETEPDDDPDNPGASLGIWLATMMLAGRDKVTLLSTPSLRPLTSWIEQLLAESTGRNGSGLVPVVGEPKLDINTYGEDRAFVQLALHREALAGLDDLALELIGTGHALASTRVTDIREAGAEFYRWQYATVLASVLTGLWPFDQPDVQASKDMARRIVTAGHEGPGVEPDSTDSVAGALRSAAKGSYLAVMVFAHATPKLDAALRELRQAVAETLGMPVTVGYGPEFLHSTGQLHKGGPKSLVGLQIHARGPVDVRVPGDAYTFGDILAAQADADLHVLRDRGLPAFRLRCGPEGPASAVLDLCRAIREAPSV